MLGSAYFQQRSPNGRVNCTDDGVLHLVLGSATHCLAPWRMANSLPNAHEVSRRDSFQDVTINFGFVVSNKILPHPHLVNIWKTKKKITCRASKRSGQQIQLLCHTQCIAMHNTETTYHEIIDDNGSGLNHIHITISHMEHHACWLLASLHRFSPWKMSLLKSTVFHRHYISPFLFTTH